jgi:hypothetical protein
MEAEVSLPCSKEPATGPCSEPDDPIHIFPPYFPKIHSNIILPFMPRYKWSISFMFPYNNFVCISYLSHTSYMHGPSHCPWFDHSITIFGEAFKLWRLSSCSHLQPPATSSLLGINILRSTLFLNTLNLGSSLTVRDQVSHPYKTRDKL